MPTTVSDSFDRADETPLGGNWSTGTGETGWNLTSNVAFAPNDTADRSSIYTGATWGNDQSSLGKLSTPGAGGGGQGPGLCVRYAAGARTYYRFVVIHSSPNNADLSRFIAGAHTALVAWTQTFTDGDTFELRVTGPASAARLEVFRNGVSVQVFTDNSSVASGSPGISYSTSSTTGTVNDWVGTDDLGGTTRQTFAPIPFMKGPQ